VKKVRIWDLPTRLFHWCLAASVIGLVITGNIGGDAMVWHFRLGYCVLTLVLFRVVWGFAGGYWSRFSSFIRGPSTVLAYLQGRDKAGAAAGHNPLGALSVLALLFFCFAQASAGLMSDDEIAAVGPLVNKIPLEWVSIATFVHTEVTKIVLVVLVILHVGAIVWYRWKKGENLITPMINGDKLLAQETLASKDTAGSRGFALVIVLLCAGVVNAMLRWAS
jgi:cytochrome b